MSPGSSGMMSCMRIVVALGGNALLRRGERGTVDEMRAQIAVAAKSIGGLAARGAGLIVTHGNGPQVGRLLLQNIAAARDVPPMPLDVLGAESQAEIGALIQQALGPLLAPSPVVTLITQVVVDPNDPAFENPTKPIGPYMLGPKAKVLQARGIPVARDEVRGGWRRVVPSPRPVRFVEEDALCRVVGAGVVPIAAGGGGVPVVPDDGGFRGVEAVVDKDLSAALLTRTLEAEALIILTDVEHVMVNRGTDRERSVGRMTIAEARRWLAEGQFGAGSMGPKVEAAIQVVSAGGRAIIASLESAEDAFDGAAGTEIVP
jgi:carbamate kinase